jgi:hypothetical protein
MILGMIFTSESILASSKHLVQHNMTITNKIEKPTPNSKSHDSKLTKSLIVLSLTILVGICIVPAYAATITWQYALTPNDGCASGPSDPFLDCVPVIIEVDEPAANLDATEIDQIQVVITSSVDSTGIILTLDETGVNTGIFTNENVALMLENNVFSITDTITVIIEDNSGASELNLPVQEIFIISDLDTLGIAPVFERAGPTSDLYTAKIKFGAVTDDSTNTIMATPGTIISVIDIADGRNANGIISPNPSGGKGAIIVEEGGTITATYYTDPVSKTGLIATSSQPIGVLPPPGRGGGGLVAPSLVVDAIPVSGDGNRCTRCIPPTLGMNERNFRLVSEGFSYNDQPVDVELFYTPYPLIVVNVGQENKAVLKIYENEGPQNIQHVEIGFGLARGQIFSESKASISLDIGYDGEKVVSSYDPENVLQDIHIETKNDKCMPNAQYECLIVTIYHTFRAPLDFNMVATNVWDFDRNAWQNYYNDGVQIVGESMNPPVKHQVFDRRGYIHTITEITKTSAVDEKGNIWNKIDGFWIMSESKPIPQVQSGRDSEEFLQKRLAEIEKAKQIFDATKIEGKKPTFFEIERTTYGRLHDPLPNMQKALMEYLTAKYP